MRLITSFGVGVIVAVSLSACQTSSIEGPSEGTAASSEARFIAVSTEPGGLGMQAKYEGMLAVTDEGCFGFQAIDGSGPITPVVFPAGSILQAGGSGVTIPGFGDLEPGDPIDSGGGEIRSDDGLTAIVPTECVDDVLLVLSFG